MERSPTQAKRRRGRARLTLRGGVGGGQRPRGTQAGRAGDVLDGGLERELVPGRRADQEARRSKDEGGGRQGPRLGQVMGLDDGQARHGRGRVEPAGDRPARAVSHALGDGPAALARVGRAGDRTFVAPSRRGADRTDVVLPGRKREGWILNVVLDTSGSMTDEIPQALGAIADFCDAVAVDQVRLVQCDTAVTSDEFLLPDEVARHEITGYGGSDLSPALRHLADDRHVEAVVVLTDGDIAYPPEEMPYDVLWVLPARATLVRPPYGAVIIMQRLLNHR